MLWLLRPRWLASHVLFLAVAVTMILLGRWQWDVGTSGGSGEGSLLNYGYALQWWVFSAFALFIWYRIVRDEHRRRAVAAGRLPAEAGPQARRARAEAPLPRPARGYVMPQMAQIVAADPDLAAYNAYLGALPTGVRQSTGSGENGAEATAARADSAPASAPGAGDAPSEPAALNAVTSATGTSTGEPAAAGHAAAEGDR